MKLIFFELKKAFGTRLLIFFLLLCVITCGLVCYTETTRDESYFYLQKIEEDYAADPAAVRSYFEETLMPLSADFERLLRAYYRGEISEEPIRSFPCTYSGDEKYNDYDLIRIFLSRQNEEEEWRRQIEKTIERAEINKEDLLIFYVNLDENSFAYRQQDLISRLYTDVLENTKLETRGYGWDQLFSFDAVNIFIFLLILAGAVVIFLSDVGRPALILRVSKNGRGRTAIAKIVALLCWVILSVFLVLLTIGVAVHLKCGAYSDLLAPMPSFYDYQFMPYSLTVWECLLIFLGTKLLLACTVAMFCALICVLVRNISLGFLTSSALVATGFIIYSSAQTDALKYLNFYGIGCFGSMIEAFRCANVFRYAVPLLPVAVVLLVLIFLLCVAAVFILFQKSRLANELRFRPFALPRRICDRIAIFLGKKGEPKPKNYGTALLSYEFRKAFMTRASVILFLLILVLKIGVSFNTYHYRSGYQRPMYEEYMETLVGENTDEKREFIKSEYEFITEKISSEGKIRSNFLQGKVEPQAYHDFLVEYQYAWDRVDLIEKIRDHSAYLDKTEEETGVAAHFLYETDWVRLFQAGADIVLMVYLVYTFSGVFADEYGGIAGKVRAPAITHTTKNGRGKLFRQKCVFVTLSSILITGLFAMIDGIFILRNFTLPDNSAPLLSLEMFGNTSVSLSLREALLISIVVKTVAALILSLVSAMIGILIKNKLYTLIASFSIAFLPEILFTFGVKPAAYFSFVNVFHRSEWLQIGSTFDFFGDWGYVFLFFSLSTIVSILITVFARKEYCK